jgi:rhamnose utilization protein RhaD (predicted bifunctional aldolase and dehydrogenase)
MQNEEEKLLREITELSHEFGTPDFVKGGGGNTSCKTGDTLWVKPSGTTLAGLAPETFVVMDRSRLRKLFELECPDDKVARESMVKEVMTAAVRPRQTARPSVEAPLHEILSPRYVVHTHAVLVNGMTCARQGEQIGRRLFPDALWIPYIDPGFTLCVDVHRRIAEHRSRHGREPQVIILENHGIFVSGDTPDEIRALYRSVLEPLAQAYAAAGVAIALRHEPMPVADDAVALSQLLHERLGEDAAASVQAAPFRVAEGPLTPDHIVYAKAFPFVGPPTVEGLAAFRSRHGYAPRVVSTSTCVLGLGATPRVAQLALDLARDGALIQQLAEAFGGVRFLSDEARDFIENWEVEAYRAQQLTY